jgi:hypothetical protein
VAQSIFEWEETVDREETIGMKFFLLCDLSGTIKSLFSDADLQRSLRQLHHVKGARVNSDLVFLIWNSSTTARTIDS